jgi:16S rRNA (guanine527-N7)-methyltransferase
MMAAVSARPPWTAQFSEATVERLERHLGLLAKWNSAINLVSPSSLEQAWARHASDSVQIFSLGGGSCSHWADLGSGAGFPGMVVALLAQELAPEMRVSLVEADRRKAEFLRTVSRETGVPVTILDSRIETLPPLQADVISARALAPLPVLCSFADRHMVPSGRAIFLKGARAEEEIAAARKDWQFDLQRLPSLTDPAASILVLAELHRV